jgi:hypothetical protein
MDAKLARCLACVRERCLVEKKVLIERLATQLIRSTNHGRWFPAQRSTIPVRLRRHRSCPSPNIDHAIRQLAACGNGTVATRLITTSFTGCWETTSNTTRSPGYSPAAGRSEATARTMTISGRGQERSGRRLGIHATHFDSFC